MAKYKEFITARNAQIRDEIKSMLAEKSPRGVKKLRESYIYDVVASKHDLKPRTVENIWQTT